MSPRIAVLLSSCVAWMLALLPASAVAAVIAVGPYTPSATSPFVVPVTITGAVGLDAFTFDLGYDPTAFAIATGCDSFDDASCDFVTGPVTPGGFYGGAAFPALFVPGFILLDAGGGQIGRLLAVAGAWQDSGPAPSGDGVLAYIEFVAVAGGSVDAPITVLGSSVPFAVAEPGTVALGAAAFAALLAASRSTRRRRRLPVGSVPPATA